MESSLKFYSFQSKASDPGKFLNLFQSLPDSIDELTKIVHNIVTHRDATQSLYKFDLPADRQLEADTRYVCDELAIIQKLKKGELDVPRSPQERLLGSCRDFALLLCSMLRFKGVPARLRCGFAAYFHTNFYTDHWVCEYFNKETNTWILVDAELGEEEYKEYNITFSHTNVPHDQFLVAGEAWRLCRANKAKPDTFGVYGIGVKGLWFVRASVLRDIASLNKVELLPWDYTDFYDKPFKNMSELSLEEISLLDKLSQFSSDPDRNFDELQEVYVSTSELQAKENITSYTLTGPRKLSL